MKWLSFRDVKAEMDKDRYRDVYLLTGEEDYLLDQLQDQLIKRFIAPGTESVDLFKLSCDKKITLEQAETIRMNILTPPFMSEKKVVLVQNSEFFSSAAFADADAIRQEIEDAAAGCGQYGLLIFRETKIDKRKTKNLRALGDDTGFIEVGKEQNVILERWLAQIARKDGLKISRKAAEELIQRCDSDMSRIADEMRKIVLYCAGEGISVIDSDTVDFVALPDLRGTVFQLYDLIAAGSTEEALNILDNLIKQREPLPRIQFMFARHIKQLICAKETDSAQRLREALNVPPFVAKRLLNQSRRFSTEKLEEIYRRIFLSDWAIKRGRMNDREAMELLIIRGSRLS